MPRHPFPETFTSCPGRTSVGVTKSCVGLSLDLCLGLDFAQVGAASAVSAMAAVSATNAADILRMRSSLG